MLETRQSTANAGHLELDGRKPLSELQELVHIALDSGQGQRVPDGAVLGWDRIALACAAHTLAPTSTTLLECELRCTGTVDANQIATETRTP